MHKVYRIIDSTITIYFLVILPTGASNSYFSNIYVLFVYFYLNTCRHTPRTSKQNLHLHILSRGVIIKNTFLFVLPLYTLL